ncbi:MAG: tetratricopeptide repeat protein [Candidatus Obscuribacterales bacterium]|nr:tetratricopeptide repeat protein [Candidatus Obscuribacterales bacterium]
MITRSLACLTLSAFVLLQTGAFANEPSKAESKSTAKSSSPEPAANKSAKPKALSEEPDTLAQINHEAVSAYKEKKYDVAQHLLEKVIAGLEKESEGELSLSEALENLGLALQQEQKTKEADAAFARSLAIRKRFHLPPVKPKMVDILPNEGYRKGGTEMVKETADIIDGKDPLFPPDKIADKSEAALNGLITTGQHQRETGDLKGAFSSFRKALSIANTMTKPNEKVVLSMNQLAGIYRHLGRPISARTLYLECMSISEQMGKADTAGFATLLDNTAQVVLMLHEDAEAQRMMERAIEIYKKTLPPDSPDLAMTMCNLGEIYLQEKQNQKGEQLVTESLAMLKKTLKPEDPRVLITEDNLAEVYSRQGKFKEAEDLQKALVATMEKIFAGKAHPDLSIAL